MRLLAGIAVRRALFSCPGAEAAPAPGRCAVPRALHRRMGVARRAVRRRRRQPEAGRRSPAQGRSRVAGGAARLLAEGDDGAERHPARRPLAGRAGELRRLQAADRRPDREQKFRDYEMPVNSDTTFWTDIGYTARKPFRSLAGLRELDRADERHPALFPRADGRDARRPEARLHAAARDARGPRRLDHRGHRCDAGEEPVLHAVQGHARHRGRRQGGAARRGRRRHRDSGAAGLSRAAEIHARRIHPGTRTDAGGRGLPDGKAYYRAQILRIHHARHGAGRDPPARRPRRSQDSTPDARGDEGDRLQGRLSRPS